MVGWTAADLKLISDDYLSTSQYQNQESEDIRHLLDKYETLGREIGDLSRILQRSGRHHYPYRDPDLARHIHDAKTDLEKHFRDGKTASAFFGRKLAIKRLNSDKVAKLQQQAVDHIKDARDFKIGFLLETKLEPLLVKELQDEGNHGSHSVSDYQATPPTRTSSLKRAQSAHEDLHMTRTGVQSTESLVDDASGALQMARFVWKSMADMSSRDRHRHRRLSYPTSAKQQYVVDVAELIENAELYAAGINMLDEASRHALEEIVSKAVQLKSAKLSPIIAQSTTDTGTQQKSSGTATVQLESNEEDHADEVISLSTKEWPPFTPLQLPPHAISGGVLGWTMDHITSKTEEMAIATATNEKMAIATEMNENMAIATELNGKMTIATELNGKMAIATELNEKISLARHSVSSSFHDVDSLERESPAHSHSKLEPRFNVSSINVVQGFDEHDLRGWVKVSSSQLRLQPTSCKLSVVEGNGEVYIEAAVSLRSHSITSARGSDSSTKTDSNPISFESSSSRGSQSAYTHKFTHFLKLHHRSIPTVKHPKYEGPDKTPQEPFTITFSKAQLIAEEGSQDGPQMVEDLKYIFSQKEHRDEIRALLFGKSLMASTGVAKIVFDYVVCTRQSISLWCDKQTGCKTITFFRQYTDSPGEVEFEVIGIEESKHISNEKKPIVLYVEPVSPRPVRQRCSLYFSDAVGKRVFLNLLYPS